MRYLRVFLLAVGGVTTVLVILWFLASYQDDSTAPVPDGVPKILAVQASDPKPHTGCVIKGGAAAVCSSGLAALMAYQRYGSESIVLQQSYAKAVLQEAGCFVITNSGPPIKQMSHGRVAVSDGWVGVTMISVGPGGGEIADSYLDGKCEAYTPVTTTLAPETSPPEFGSSSDENKNVPETTPAPTPTDQ
jgi:hypothetical protein